MKYFNVITVKVDDGSQSCGSETGSADPAHPLSLSLALVLVTGHWLSAKLLEVEVQCSLRLSVSPLGPLGVTAGAVHIQMEISSTEDHPEPGETCVTRQETQSCLPQTVLHIGYVREEGVAKTGEVLDVLWPLQAATASVGLTH